MGDQRARDQIEEVCAVLQEMTDDLKINRLLVLSCPAIAQASQSEQAEANAFRLIEQGPQAFCFVSVVASETAKGVLGASDLGG